MFVTTISSTIALFVPELNNVSTYLTANLIQKTSSYIVVETSLWSPDLFQADTAYAKCCVRLPVLASVLEAVSQLPVIVLFITRVINHIHFLILMTFYLK